MKRTLSYPLLLLLIVICPQSWAEQNNLDSYTKAYKPCMDKAISTQDMIECADKEYLEQDKRLNAAYKALLSRQTQNRANQLLDLQRLWIKYRDANCKFYYDPDGGSIARILANDCMLTMTKDRANELQSMMTP